MSYEEKYKRLVSFVLQVSEHSLSLDTYGFKSNREYRKGLIKGYESVLMMAQKLDEK